MKQIKDYNDYVFTKDVDGWKRTTRATSLDEAVENFYKHLKAYKYTKEMVRKLTREEVV